ncbi:MAG: RNA polymerase sigma-70 factor [Chitinophagaceae bacterium]
MNTPNELQAQPSYNELQLLKEVADGDAGAFKLLYNIYQHKLYGYSYSLIKNHAQSEDILQEVFLKIWLNRKDLVKIECFNSYLFSMIKHRIFNILKQSYHQNMVSRQIATDLPDENFSTETSFDHSQLLEKVHYIIERLPPQQKNVYLLSRDYGLKQKEIADRMGITVTTVKKHLTLALHFIRKNLDITITIGILLRQLKD